MEKTNNCTPGPWKVWSYGESEIDVAVGPSAGGLAVAQITTCNAHGIHTAEAMKRGQDNARLIAASPNLAKSLKAMLDVFDNELVIEKLGSKYGLEGRCAIDFAKATLAQAEGEYPEVSKAVARLLKIIPAHNPPQEAIFASTALAKSCNDDDSETFAALKGLLKFFDSVADGESSEIDFARHTVKIVNLLQGHKASNCLNCPVQQHGESKSFAPENGKELAFKVGDEVIYLGDNANPNPDIGLNYVVSGLYQPDMLTALYAGGYRYMLNWSSHWMPVKESSLKLKK